MRKGLLLLGLLVLWTASPARAELNIGINVSIFPQLERVPGYPVYYAPGLESNYFFYDGSYWVYQDDGWYSSYWYNGPWEYMDPEFVPLFVLRVPVRYYRRPPLYFRGWQSDAPPRWGDHWGRDWSQRRSGWDRWDRRAAPAPAPLPVYQRQYSGNRYPPVSQQRELQSRNYNYHPAEERHVGRDRPQQSTRDAAPSPSSVSRPQQQQQRQQESRRPEQQQGQQRQNQQRQQESQQQQQQQQRREQSQQPQPQPQQRQPQQKPDEQKQQSPRRPNEPNQDRPRNQGDKRDDKRGDGHDESHS